MGAGLFAAVSSGLFAGASLYVNLVEHPARRQMEPGAALAEFAPSYRRATVTQASFASVGFVSSLLAWRSQQDAWWLLGGGLLASVIPYTLLVIRPTNKHLLDPTTATNGELAEQLLARWGRLHAVRSILSTAAFIVCLFLLTKRKR